MFRVGRPSVLVDKVALIPFVLKEDARKGKLTSRSVHGDHSRAVFVFGKVQSPQKFAAFSLFSIKNYVLSAAPWRRSGSLLLTGCVGHTSCGFADTTERVHVLGSHK